MGTPEFGCRRGGSRTRPSLPSGSAPWNPQRITEPVSLRPPLGIAQRSRREARRAADLQWPFRQVRVANAFRDFAKNYGIGDGVGRTFPRSSRRWPPTDRTEGHVPDGGARTRVSPRQGERLSLRNLGTQPPVSAAVASREAAARHRCDGSGCSQRNLQPILTAAEEHGADHCQRHGDVFQDEHGVGGGYARP